MKGPRPALPKTSAMSAYHHLEAYQLTRSLLAGVYQAMPPEPENELKQRLRHAAVAAATSLVGVSPEPSESEAQADTGKLQQARTALAEVARTLAECHRDGHLPEHWYETLRASHDRATEALAALD